MNITRSKYSIVLSLFFISYISFISFSLFPMDGDKPGRLLLPALDLAHDLQHQAFTKLKHKKDLWQIADDSLLGLKTKEKTKGIYNPYKKQNTLRNPKSQEIVKLERKAKRERKSFLQKVDINEIIFNEKGEYRQAIDATYNKPIKKVNELVQKQARQSSMPRLNPEFGIKHKNHELEGFKNRKVAKAELKFQRKLQKRIGKTSAATKGIQTPSFQSPEDIPNFLKENIASQIAKQQEKKTKPKSLSCKSNEIFTLKSQPVSQNADTFDLAKAAPEEFNVVAALEENKFLKQHMALQRNFNSLKSKYAEMPYHTALVECSQALEKSTQTLQKIFDNYPVHSLESRTLPLKFTANGEPLEYSALEKEDQALRHYNWKNTQAITLDPIHSPQTKMPQYDATPSNKTQPINKPKITQTKSNLKTAAAFDLAKAAPEEFNVVAALEENKFLKKHMALQRNFDSLKAQYAHMPHHPELVECSQTLEKSNHKLQKIFDKYPPHSLESRTLPLKFTPDGKPLVNPALLEENHKLRHYCNERKKHQTLIAESTKINSENLENNKTPKLTTPKKTISCDIPDEYISSKSSMPTSVEKIETQLERELEKVSSLLDKAINSAQGKKIVKAENRFLRYYIKLYDAHSNLKGGLLLDYTFEDAAARLHKILKSDKSKSFFAQVTHISERESALIAENQFLKYYVELQHKTYILSPQNEKPSPRFLKCAEKLKQADKILKKYTNKPLKAKPQSNKVNKPTSIPKKTISCDILDDTLTPKKLEALEKAQKANAGQPYSTKVVPEPAPKITVSQQPTIFSSTSPGGTLHELNRKHDEAVTKFREARKDGRKFLFGSSEYKKTLRREDKAFEESKKIRLKQARIRAKLTPQANVPKQIMNVDNAVLKPSNTNHMSKRVLNENSVPKKPLAPLGQKVVILPKKEIPTPSNIHWPDPETIKTGNDLKTSPKIAAKPPTPANKPASRAKTIVNSAAQKITGKSSSPSKPNLKPSSPGTALTTAPNPAPTPKELTAAQPAPKQKSLAARVLKVMNKHKATAPIVHAVKLMCETDLGKNSRLCKSLDLDELATQSKDVKNAHRDAFILAGSRIALGAVTFAIPGVGPYLDTAVIASSQAESARQSLQAVDTNKMCPPSADVFYQMYIGTTCKESFENTKIVLKAGERLDRVADKIAHFVADGVIAGCNATGLTEENYKKAAEFVHGCMEKAPPFIQESYQELIGVKKSHASTSNNRPAKTDLNKLRKENSNFLEALRKSLNPKLDKETQEKARAEYEKILKTNPTLLSQFEDLQKKMALESHQKRAVQAQKKKAVADKKFNLTQKDAAKKITELLDENFKSVDTKIRELTEYIVQKDQQEYEQKQQEYEVYLKEQRFEQFLNDVNDGFSIASSIASIFGNDEASYRFAVLGGATVQTISALNAFSTMGLQCGISPYAGALSAIAGICSLFKKRPKDNSVEVILEAFYSGIRHLSNQIREMHKSLLAESIDIKKILNKHQLAILEKFFDISHDQKNMAQKMRELHHYIKVNNNAIFSSFDSLHEKIDLQTRMISREFQGIHTAGIDDAIEKARLTLPDPVSESKFRKIIVALSTKAIKRAATDSLTGGGVDIASFNALQVALSDSAQRKNIFEHPAFSSINLLSRYLNYKLPNFNHLPLVNPLIWIKCTAEIAHQLSARLQDPHYPSTKNHKDSDIERLKKIREEGQKIIDFITQIHGNNSLTLLLESYRESAHNLAAAITSEQHKFQEAATTKKHADYRAFAKKEKALLNMLPEKYECTKCVEETEKTIKQVQGIYASGVKFNTIFHGIKYEPLQDSFRGINDTRECKELHAMKQVQVVPLRNFSQLLPSYLAFQQEALKLNFEKLITDLEHDEMTYSSAQKSLIMHPETNKKELPTLLVPGDIYLMLAKEPYFLAAEIIHGTLKHCYSIEKEKFFLRSYLILKEGETKNKFLIQELSRPYKGDPLYSKHENALHHWYGDRYPLSKDVYKVLACWTGNYQHTGHYPPVTPYPAGFDTFATTATKTVLDLEPIKLRIWRAFKRHKIEERIQFNQTICNALSSHASTSDVFQAAQKFDVNYKLLESYLALMYNTRFQPLQPSPHSIKNSTDFSRYCASYNDTNNQETEQGNYAPHHIKNTAQNVLDAFSTMLRPTNKPSLKPVEALISALDRLITAYKLRPICERKKEPAQPLSMSDVAQQNVIHENTPSFTIEAQSTHDGQAATHLSALLETNKELAQEVSVLKEKLAYMDKKFDFMTNQMSSMVALLMQLQKNKTLLNSQTSAAQPSPFCYKTIIKNVAQQTEAECGYHALFNALSYYRKDLSLPTFIQENKRSIQLSDDSFNGQWLSEDQLELLLQKYKTYEMNVTIIPDIFMYQDGHSGLERSVLEGLADAQQAATAHIDGYKHVFLLGTMNGRAHNRMTHWFAVAQIIEDGQEYYEVMNSLPSYSHEKQVKILQNILHNKGNRYNFAFFDADLENELEQAISQLNLVTILEQPSYARKGESGASVYRIVDKTPTQIIDAVVHAANLVLGLTGGNQFWSTSGAIDPKLLIQDALITIKNSVGTTLECKENSTDKEGLFFTVALTKEQEHSIAALERIL